MTSTAPTSFEKAFERLEQILEQLNSGRVNLEDSLKLYEEADRLIVDSHKKLAEAEKKIEVLVKNRNAELALGPNNTPKLESL